METPEGPSDAELIARVRTGDLEAYGELFARHHHAAERMARQLVPANDADDLASDAFAKVLDALRNGGGPDISFRAYLLTTVRRVHVDRIRSGRKVQTTDDIAAYEREPQGFDDPSVTGFESGAAAKAFASLPERWQAVLWHTEVEGEKPATIAPMLGLTANGVSALAYRAREGLRQAYLQQHLADVAGDRCRWTTERLGAYVRGGLTKRENKNVRAPGRLRQVHCGVLGARRGQQRPTSAACPGTARYCGPRLPGSRLWGQGRLRRLPGHRLAQGNREQHPYCGCRRRRRGGRGCRGHRRHGAHRQRHSPGSHQSATVAAADAAAACEPVGEAAIGQTPDGEAPGGPTDHQAPA
jgi:RNA polymerase sigma factor (sigma-70 family)